VKIYVALVEALRKKERRGETQKTINFDGFLSFTLSFFLMCCFAGLFFESHPVYDETQGTGAVFS